MMIKHPLLPKATVIDTSKIAKEQFDLVEF